MNRRKEGAYYENLVAEYLKTQGYEILEKNYRCRIGEIDLIAKEGETLVFVEVKYRRNDKMGESQRGSRSKKAEKNLHDSVLLSDAGVRAYGYSVQI